MLCSLVPTIPKTFFKAKSLRSKIYKIKEIKQDTCEYRRAVGLRCIVHLRKCIGWKDFKALFIAVTDISKDTVREFGNNGLSILLISWPVFKSIFYPHLNSGGKDGGWLSSIHLLEWELHVICLNIRQYKISFIYLFTEKPAIAPPVFVFQKDKAQKVRKANEIFLLRGWDKRMVFGFFSGLNGINQEGFSSPVPSGNNKMLIDLLRIFFCITEKTESCSKICT